MTPLRWRLRQCAGMLGWQGLAGIAFAAAAAALYFAGIAPARTQTSRLQQEALSAREFSRTNLDAANMAPRTYETWLEHFYRLLPPHASAPDCLRIIFAAASAESLN